VVEFWHTTQAGLQVLSELQSPIADVTIWRADGPDGIADPSFDVIHILSNLRQSLRLLSLQYPRHDIHAQHDVIYPLVETLTIDTYCWDRPSLTGFAHTFPNLDHLKWEVESEMNDEDVESLRQHNESQYYRWTTLDTLDCHIMWAYAFAFKSSVRRWNAGVLSIDGPSQYDIYTRYSAQFRKAIAEVQPKHLSLHVHLRLSDDPAFNASVLWPKVSTMFPAVGITQ